MFKRKEVTVPVGSELSREVSLSRSDKIIARVFSSAMAFCPVGFGTLATYDSMMALMATNPSYVIAVLGGMTVAGSVGGLAINNILNSESLSNQIAKVIDLDKKFITTAHVNQKMKELQKTKGERILLKSFYVKETGQLDITDWKIEGDSHEFHSTHKINQYLIKEKGKFRVEQEAIVNNEAIWDLSADALVEVYAVQEKTALKELIQ